MGNVVRYRPQKPARSEPNRMLFTERALDRLRPPRDGQVIYWDTVTKAMGGSLSLLVSSGGTKLFRSTYQLDGRTVSRKLGRFPAMKLTRARELAVADRADVAEGKDPREKKKQAERQRQAEASKIFSVVVDQFIEKYAKVRQRSWKETERVLNSNCVSVWGDKPIGEITKDDARTLLNGFIEDGHKVKALNTLAWMKKLWRWAWEQDLVASPLMDAVKLDVVAGIRERYFSDDEIRAIWKAAGKLDKVECAYVRLLLLLAPRKTALAKTKWSDLDLTTEPARWVTPHEFTKSRKTAKKKRVYLTPLPPLAISVLKEIVPARRNADDLVFPHPGGSIAPKGRLKKKLVDRGAPPDFSFHAARHTVATWLENQGHSEWERGLVLNHASTSVTAGYSHGYPLKLKFTLLAKWAAHVERLVQAKGPAPLR